MMAQVVAWEGDGFSPLGLACSVLSAASAINLIIPSFQLHFIYLGVWDSVWELGVQPIRLAFCSLISASRRGVLSMFLRLKWCAPCRSRDVFCRGCRRERVVSWRHRRLCAERGSCLRQRLINGCPKRAPENGFTHALPIASVGWLRQSVFPLLRGGYPH